jgi:hypothetical protein
MQEITGRSVVAEWLDQDLLAGARQEKQLVKQVNHQSVAEEQNLRWLALLALDCYQAVFRIINRQSFHHHPFQLRRL